MNTALFPTDTAARTFLGQFAVNVRAVFSRLDSTRNAFAASLASELRDYPELSSLVLSLANVPRRARVASLLRTAGELRRDWETFGAADALKRIASRPSLFTAVTRELHEQAECCAA